MDHIALVVENKDVDMGKRISRPLAKSD